MMLDRISLAYWFPKLQVSGVPVPKTEIVTTDADFLSLLDGQPSPSADGFLDHLKERCREWGYPLFLRTGHTSAKHSWKNSCHVASEEALGHSVWELIEASYMAMPEMPTNVWAIRELLDLDVRFRGFWGELPIAVEWRYFIEPQRVICHHPYWPPEAFERTSNWVPSNWMTLLEEMNAEPSEDEQRLLNFYCDEILTRGEFEGAWALDFARAGPMRWYAIDMAPAEVSWHWPDCEAYR